MIQQVSFKVNQPIDFSWLIYKLTYILFPRVILSSNARETSHQIYYILHQNQKSKKVKTQFYHLMYIKYYFP